MQEYLNNNSIKKLHVGCGPNVLYGWLNTDANPEKPNVHRLDITTRTPFPDSTFDYVFNEHMIEHLSYSQGLAMLRECFRIMKPGARIRTSCPSIDFLIKLYNDPDDFEKQYIAWATKHFTSWAPYQDGIFVLNNFVRDFGHRFIYNQKTLEKSLSLAGFINFTTHKIQESADPNLCNLEHDGRMPAGFLQLETMTIEAVKP